MTTKARTSAQKLADKRRQHQARLRALSEAQGLPELAPIPEREDRHRRGGKFARKEEDASLPSLMARRRKMGLEVTTVPIKQGDEEDDAAFRARRSAAKRKLTEEVREFRAPWFGCEAGRAMIAVVSSDADRSTLWDAIQKMRVIQTAYDRALGAPDRHAQSLRLLLPQEEMSADAESPPVDLRDDDDKHRQAVASWMKMHSWLGYVEARAASVTLRCVLDDTPCKDAAAMVRALRCVADGMSGKNMVYRGV